MTSVIVPPVDLAPGMPSRVVTISATDVTEGGKSLEGQMVRFALSDTLDVSRNGDVIAKTQAEVVLDANGEGQIRLPVYDENVKTWCGRDWAILVTATWGSQKAIRVPAGSSSIALSALPPVRPLRGRELQWAITGVSVSTKEGGQWGASVSLNGGILDFDFTVPPGGEAWAKGALAPGTDLNSLSGQGIFYQSNSGNAATELNYPAPVAGAVHQFQWGTGVVQVYYPYTANTQFGDRIYMRSRGSSSWFPWLEILSSAETDKRYSPRIGLSLDDSTNLNSLPGPGVYYQSKGAQATALLNYPVPLGGTLVQHSWGTGMTQIYYPYSVNIEHGRKIYYRSRGNTAWGPWLSFLSTADADERYVRKGEGGGGSVDPAQVSSIVADDIADPTSQPRAALDTVIDDALATAGSPLNVITSSEVRRVVAAEAGTTPALADGDMVVYYHRAGAHYYTNFSDATVDQHPAGFSEPWQDQAWLVKAVPEATGGKALTVAPPVGDSLHALLVWDAVTVDPDRADAELLYRVRSTGPTPRILVEAVLRASGTEETRTGYRAGTHSTKTVSASKYIDGVWSSSTTVAIPEVVPDAWYMVRFRVEGNTQKVKVWLDTDPEPDWMVVTTDITIPDPGGVGLLAYGMPNRQEIDWIAVATGGRTATPW